SDSLSATHHETDSARCSCGKPQASVTERLEEPVVDESGDAALHLHRVRARVSKGGPWEWCGTLTQPVDDLAPYLPVGAGPGLAPTGWSRIGRPAPGNPLAVVEHRALGAPGPARHADQGAQLHDGDIPRRRCFVVRGEETGRQVVFSAGQTGSGMLHT